MTPDAVLPALPIEPASPQLDPATHEGLAQSMERFSRDRYTRAQWHAYGRDPDGYSLDNCKRMLALGWFALGLPETIGGTGTAIRDLLPLFFAAGRALWREPLLPILGDACGALLCLEPSESRDQLLCGVVTGERRPAFVRPRPDAGVVTQPRPGDVRGYVAHGRARQVVAASSCTDFIVPARTVEGGIACLIAVNRNAPGVRVTPLAMLDGRRAATVDFHSSPAYLIGSRTTVADAECRGAILAAAEACGIMQAVVAETIAHLNVRRQFGQPLANFQVLQHRVVDMHIQETESLAHVWAVARAHDERDPNFTQRLLRLRVQVADAARRVTQDAIQLHGGMGMTQDSPIGDYYKRAAVLRAAYLLPEDALSALENAADKARL
jgi:alkylation response protein AidB-like acyl-CoA dehydrogenase